MSNNQFLNPDTVSLEDEVEQSGVIRPSYLDDFIGQAKNKENLQIYIDAAKSREEQLDHILFYGPPGLGKTTLASIIANEMGVNMRQTSGPLLTKTGDLAAILSNMQEGDVLFIDEIHRMQTNIEEILYTAMEDFVLDIIIGEGPAARTMRINLPKFTLIGATTRLGLLSSPLRDRFGIPLRLDFYKPEELKQIIIRGCNIMDIDIDASGASEVAKRSRGTPRISLRLIRRVRDFCHSFGTSMVTAESAAQALERLDIDAKGLDSNDIKYLQLISTSYGGGPVGIETIAAALSEHRDSIEDTIEPYLLQQGLISRTPRGRMLTHSGQSYINKKHN